MEFRLCAQDLGGSPRLGALATDGDKPNDRAEPMMTAPRSTALRVPHVELTAPVAIFDLGGHRRMRAQR